MQSLDGYVAGREGGPQLGAPTEAVHRHFNHQVRNGAGELYGRGLYDVMRAWDGEWAMEEVERDFANAWRPKTKWVVSKTLKEVGPNAVLIAGDAMAEVARIKATVEGEINVGGPLLAAGLAQAGLLDEYWLYLMPVVLGGGKQFFAPGFVPKLQSIGQEAVADGVVRVGYRVLR
jgi:dihydrofolate reductase